MFSLNKIFPDSFHSGILTVVYFLPVKTGGRKKPYCFSLAIVGRCLAFAICEFFICSGHSLMNLLLSFCVPFSCSFLSGLSVPTNLLILWTIVVADLKASSDVPSLLVSQCLRTQVLALIDFEMFRTGSASLTELCLIYLVYACHLVVSNDFSTSCCVQ